MLDRIRAIDVPVVILESVNTIDGGREGILTIPGVSEISAAQEGCILVFDDQHFGGGGPRLGRC